MKGKKQDFLDIHAIAEKIYGKARAASIMKAKYKDIPYKGFDQPLPDIVGYKQHSGECVSDSIQETLLFADEIRDYVQPILYGLTTEQIELRTRLFMELDDWEKYQEYFHFIQRRFRAHYDVLQYLRTHDISAQTYYKDYDAVCERNPLFKKKKRASVEAGVLAVKHFKEEEIYTGTGLLTSDVQNILQYFFQCLGIPFTQERGVFLDAVGIILHAEKIDIMENGLEKKRSIGHSVSFIKVLGKWLYYDDNIGFIQADESVIEALKQDRLRIILYKKVYFVRLTEGRKGLESVWTAGGWSSDLGELYTDKGTLPVGLYMYDTLENRCFSILRKPLAFTNETHIRCYLMTKDLQPKTGEQLLETMEKFRACIYAHLDSNSAIFENLYRFLFDSIELAKAEPETMEFLEKTCKTVVLRPACSPMTHYWCYKIARALKGDSDYSANWFGLPQYSPIHVAVPIDTPQERLLQIEEAMKKREQKRTPSLTPCLPGQVRNAKTRKCVERKQRSPGEKKEKTEGEREKTQKNNSTKKSTCPKGEVRDSTTGLCVKRLEPCPPGQVRNKSTKECRGRMKKGACPPGQILDPKTKECRDAIQYKF